MRIGISGSYGGLNLGDEAILESILQQLCAAVDARVTVFSRNPRDTLARHRVARAVAVRSMTRKEITPEVEALDLLILGGGGILYDGEAETYLREVLLAHELGVPVIVYAVSAGPLTDRVSRRAVREALNATGTKLLTVRGRLGYRLLEDVGVTDDIHLTADPAFLLKPDEPAFDALEAEGARLGEPLVGFSVREPGPAAPHIDPDDYYSLPHGESEANERTAAPDTAKPRICVERLDLEIEVLEPGTVCLHWKDLAIWLTAAKLP